MDVDTEIARYDELTEWLSSAHQTRLYQACAAVELTPTQFIALSAVEQLGEPKMSTLAQHLGLSPGGATTLLDRLVKHGLVERIHDPVDRRCVSIHMLPKGTTALQQARAGKRERVRTPFLKLAPDVRAQLLTCLEALHATWTTLDAAHE